MKNHGEDFGVCAEWHFFATWLGKGPCGGIGEAVNRLAAKDCRAYYIIKRFLELDNF